MTTAERLLKELVRDVLYEEDNRELTLILSDECGICTSGVRHMKLCSKHAAEAYCRGLTVERNIP